MDVNLTKGTIHEFKVKGIRSNYPNSFCIKDASADVDDATGGTVCSFCGFDRL